MGFHLRVPFFFLLQTCSFYILILISAVAKLRRMQIQISNIINGINKHNKRGCIFSFKVHHLECVTNYSFPRILRNLRDVCNLHRKPQVTRNFATLGPAPWVPCERNARVITRGKETGAKLKYVTMVT